MSLTELLAARAPIADLARHLDGLDATTREKEGLGLDRVQQQALWEVAADAPKIRLEHFVPRATPPLTAVHHPGRNTIPPFRRYQDFEKRFMKPAANATEVHGYNESAAWFIRPGYFVAYETDAPRVSAEDQARWASRGGVVIDYHLVPPADAPVPEGWPKVIPNSQGLQRFVYHGTRDFMRKVSDHVSIGRASGGEGEKDKELDFWFVLIRR